MGNDGQRSVRSAADGGTVSCLSHQLTATDRVNFFFVLPETRHIMSRSVRVFFCFLLSLSIYINPPPPPPNGKQKIGPDEVFIIFLPASKRQKKTKCVSFHFFSSLFLAKRDVSFASRSRPSAAVASAGCSFAVWFVQESVRDILGERKYFRPFITSTPAPPPPALYHFPCYTSVTPARKASTASQRESSLSSFPPFPTAPCPPLPMLLYSSYIPR